jgi:hypothetical protein
MSWSGCSSVKVISADQVESRVVAGQAFKAPSDGWFLPDARYQRYRRLVADKILEAATPAQK